MKGTNNSTGYVLRNRRLACENSKFKVFFDHIEGKEGLSVPDYLVVAPKHKTANMVTGVAVLPIVDGKYALLEVYRHAIEDYSWEIPRGFVEAEEAGIESVNRELEEETGLRCEKDHLVSLGYLTPDAGTLAARIHLFVATQCQWQVAYVANEIGHRSLRLFEDAEVASMVEESIIQDPCTLIAYYRHMEKVRKEHGLLMVQRNTASLAK